ncbi:MAG: hypothetical protein OZ921_08595 [Sorangiineae bacterium]|nr:hypothetical protein [Polyangiaceae bacterium]MEB2322558.1 hypothetical protein [Sorangiineae bacterium]
MSHTSRAQPDTAAAPHEVFPAFFDDAPVIDVIDPLSGFLGAVEGGRLRYRYADVVRLAGHSCPTMASAFLMTRAGLKALYGEALPRRGEIRVDVRGQRAEGVAGVIASACTLITGATDDWGFHGIGGKFMRRDKLFFGQPLEFGELRFSRLDGGAPPVEVNVNLQSVGSDPRVSALIGPCLRELASAEDRALFRTLWQDRVRRILVEHCDDPEVVQVRAVSRAS